MCFANPTALVLGKLACLLTVQAMTSRRLAINERASLYFALKAHDGPLCRRAHVHAWVARRQCDQAAAVEGHALVYFLPP